MDLQRLLTKQEPPRIKVRVNRSGNLMDLSEREKHRLHCVDLRHTMSRCCPISVEWLPDDSGLGICRPVMDTVMMQAIKSSNLPTVKFLREIAVHWCYYPSRTAEDSSPEMIEFINENWPDPTRQGRLQDQLKRCTVANKGQRPW